MRQITIANSVINFITQTGSLVHKIPPWHTESRTSMKTISPFEDKFAAKNSLQETTRAPTADQSIPANILYTMKDKSAHAHCPVNRH